jgi:formate/nitrite transporter FocA (FNT family)
MDDINEQNATEAQPITSATEDSEPHAKTRILFSLVLFAALASLAFGIIGLFTFSWVSSADGYRRMFNPLPSGMLIGGGLAMVVTSALGLLLCDIADDLSAIRRRGDQV